MVGSIGNTLPAEAENIYYGQLENSKELAVLLGVTSRYKSRGDSKLSEGYLSLLHNVRRKGLAGRGGRLLAVLHLDANKLG